VVCRMVTRRGNSAQSKRTVVCSCTDETHSSHSFVLQGSLKPQVELMNRIIVQYLLAAVVVE
jgi:hypothetical protein